MKKYLIVNRGSASEKYAIYTAEKCLAFLHLEEAATDRAYVGTLYLNGKQEEKCVTKKLQKSSKIFLKQTMRSGLKKYCQSLKKQRRR